MAQWLASWAHNSEVPGSIPGFATFLDFFLFFWHFFPSDVDQVMPSLPNMEVGTEILHMDIESLQLNSLMDIHIMKNHFYIMMVLLNAGLQDSDLLV